MNKINSSEWFGLGMLAALLIASFVIALSPKPSCYADSRLDLGVKPDSCWFVWADKGGILTKVHVWNFTDDYNKTSCQLLKDECFDIQINHLNGHLPYNCRWLYSSEMYGNESCLCSATTIDNVLNVTG